MAALLEPGASALNGKTPIDRFCELLSKIPSGETVEAAYEPAKERIYVASYALDSTLAQVK
jgi:hypothetical protein